MAAKKTENVQMTEQEAKMKALSDVLGKIEKDFGKGSIMKLGDEHVEHVSVKTFMKKERIERSLQLQIINITDEAPECCKCPVESRKWIPPGACW